MLEKKIHKIDYIESIGSSATPLFEDVLMSIICVSTEWISSNLDYLKNNLKTNSLCVSIPIHFKFKNILNLIENVNPDFLQFTYNHYFEEKEIIVIKSLDVGLIFSGLEIDYDDEFEWVMGRYSYIFDLNADFYQIDLLPSIEDKWFFLLNESPKFTNEFQLNDLKKICKEKPVLLTSNFKKEDYFDIENSVPDLKGFSEEFLISPHLDI